jgi:hypothetical protein
MTNDGVVRHLQQSAHVQARNMPCCRVLLLSITDLDNEEEELQGNLVVTLLEHGSSRPAAPQLFCSAKIVRVFCNFSRGVRMVGDVRRLYLLVKTLNKPIPNLHRNDNKTIMALHVEGVVGPACHKVSWRQFLQFTHQSHYGSRQWATSLGMNYSSIPLKLLQIRRDINIVPTVSAADIEFHLDDYSSSQAFLIGLGKYRLPKKRKRARRAALLSCHSGIVTSRQLSTE